MYKFKTNIEFFVQETRQRVILEVSIFVLLAGFFWSTWSTILPFWLELSLLIFIAIFILMDLIPNSEAKDAIENFSICFLDDVLKFPTHEFIYNELSILKIRKKKNEVIEIHLKTNKGDVIKLRGLNDMETLSKIIVKYIKPEEKQ